MGIVTQSVPPFAVENLLHCGYPVPLVTRIFDPFALIIDELSQWQSVRSHNRPALAIAQVTRLRLNKVLSEWRFETTNYVMANNSL